MTAAAYVYVPTPPPSALPRLIGDIVSDLSISHAGFRDPPKKWVGTTEGLVALVERQRELTRYLFLRDKDKHIDISLAVRSDTQWTWSTVSIGARDAAQCTALALVLCERLDPYLCIQGIEGGGKDQPWVVHRRRPDCPADLSAAV